MNNLVGYIVDGAEPDKMGQIYNYSFNKNGVFIHARNSHLVACIPVAECKIRGLQPLDTNIRLTHGHIPQRFWALALSVLLAHPEEERYVGIRWTGTAYDLYYPAQDGKTASLTYECGDDIVFEMHSHPGFGLDFSFIDDKDEQGLKIYGIIGEHIERRINIRGTEGEIVESSLKMQEVNLRVGVYGYFHPVKWSEVFEGSLGEIIDITSLIKEDKEGGDGEAEAKADAPSE
jgi:hypothetical protein